MFGFRKNKSSNKIESNTLLAAEINKAYTIKSILQDDKEVASFLSTLGCFAGETITVVSVLSDTYVISVKDARYSIDSDLAKTVIVN
ncbi:FeoA family protein [Vibrio rhodolitus]|uniref:FeoA family protein n=1 Tax=Vibrio rhodolitus TaxID=2231649 RepID=UPI000E0A9D24|nr:FeoA family protein [Vibrio rhodolitus]